MTHLSGNDSAGHWKTSLFASSQEEAEKTMVDLGWQWKWKSDGSLFWFSDLPAIRRHPITNEEVFLSSTSFLQSFRSQTGKPKLFGDGSQMTMEEWKSVRRAHAAEEVEVMLEPGDIVLVDNWLVKHGRRAFQGPRKHLVFFSDTFVTAETKSL